MFLTAAKILSCFLGCLILGTNAKILTLDDSNFEKLTQASTGSTSGIHMVFFYADWCPHCQAFTPIYEEVAQVYETNPERNSLGFVFSKINRDENPLTAKRFTVNKIPTVLIFRNNKLYETDERTKGDLTLLIEDGLLDLLPSAWEPVPPELSYSEILADAIIEELTVVSSDYSTGALVIFICGIGIGTVATLFLKQFCSVSAKPKRD